MHLLAVELFLYLIADALQGRSSGFDVVVDAENNEALAGADGLGEFAGLEGESLVFQFLGEIVALEVAEIATLIGSRAVGLLAGEFVELWPRP